MNALLERIKRQEEKEETRGISVRVPVAQFEAVQSARKKDRVSMTKLISSLLEVYLEGRKK